MNVVWPVCALCGSVLVVLAYARIGVPPARSGQHGKTPFPAAVAKGDVALRKRLHAG